MQNFKYIGKKNEKNLVGYVKANTANDAIKQLNDFGIDVQTIEKADEKVLNNISDKKIFNYKAFSNEDKNIQVEGVILARNENDAYKKLVDEFNFYDVEVENGSAFVIYTTKKNTNNFLLEIYSLSKWLLFFFSLYLFAINTHVFIQYQDNMILGTFVLILFIIFLIFDYNINKFLWKNKHDIYNHTSFLSFIFIFILGVFYCIGYFFYNHTFYLELPLISLSIVYFVSTSIVEEFYNENIIKK